jgi:hypothetical protein
MSEGHVADMMSELSKFEQSAGHVHADDTKL